MPDFRSIYRHGFARVAACTLPVGLADPLRNADATAALAADAGRAGAVLAVFPELGISGYAIDDLRLQDALLDAVEQALLVLSGRSRGLPLMLVGAPLRRDGAVFNCAVAVGEGRILGVVPKSYLPNYREFYEVRQFAPGTGHRGGRIDIRGTLAPFGTDLLFEAEDVTGLVLAVEVCEDLWVPQPPSTAAALAGATVVANLSASNITIGKAETRRLLCQAQSARAQCAYVYAAAGEGESTNDVAWDGQCAIFEAGAPLAESERFPTGPHALLADLDLDLLRQERARMNTFDANRAANPPAAPYRRIPVRLDPPAGDLGLRRPLERFPFVPSDPARLQQDCFEAYNIQVSALMQRMRAIDAKTLVIGVSGGLDSTQALIVAARAVDRLSLGRGAIRAYTMPGFGTGDETRRNALLLMEALGVSAETLDIRPSATLMLQQMGHPFGRGEPVYDVTFENVQAGLRTDYLFRLANQLNGIVVGTGDLSELGLGWCTYGVGDQMSHYNVNAGLPKTLIQHLIRWVISARRFEQPVLDTLDAILATEISPELVPAGADRVLQSTESTIGPYALQDFTLFYLLRYGFRPSKVAFLALHAWEDSDRGTWPPGFPPARRAEYALPEIRHWMEVFLRRFFAFSQFKRTAMPNGPKVSTGGSLSPRGDWRAPSDGSARVWLDELAANVPSGDPARR